MPKIFDLADDSLVRPKAIIGPGNPIYHQQSTRYVWRKANKVPQAVRLGPNTAAYRAGDVKALVRAFREPAGSHR